MIYLQLFYEFFITGLFMFGGGLAAIPFLQQMGESTGWFTTQELMDMIAIAEATPGPIGINMATYAGFTAAGVPGGIVASVGMLIPSVTIALVIARLLVRFKESKYVEYTLYGLRPASLGLISAAGLTVFSLVLFGVEVRDLIGEGLFLFDYRALILAAVLLIATNIYKKAHPVLYLLISAVIGILIF